MEPNWLKLAKQLQAISQTGLTYATDQYDIERYQQIRHIAAQIFAEKSDFNRDLIVEIFTAQSGYTTPKVDTRGVVFRDDKILLVKEISDGLWTLPGGWADVGISPSENVTREVFEESGFETEAKKILAIIDRSKHPHTPPAPFHIYKIFFLCEIIAGEPKPSNETSEVAFFAENNIPPLSLTRILPEQLNMMFEYHHNPAKQPYFD